MVVWCLLIISLLYRWLFGPAIKLMISPQDCNNDYFSKNQSVPILATVSKSATLSGLPAYLAEEIVVQNVSDVHQQVRIDVVLVEYLVNVLAVAGQGLGEIRDSHFPVFQNFPDSIPYMHGYKDVEQFRIFRRTLQTSAKQE